jgi:hypothetical protein
MGGMPCRAQSILGTPVVAAASLGLGNLLAGHGDVEAARAAFQLAVDSGVFPGSRRRFARPRVAADRPWGCRSCTRCLPACSPLRICANRRGGSPGLAGTPLARPASKPSSDRTTQRWNTARTTSAIRLVWMASWTSKTHGPNRNHCGRSSRPSGAAGRGGAPPRPSVAGAVMRRLPRARRQRWRCWPGRRRAWYRWRVRRWCRRRGGICGACRWPVPPRRA